MIIYLSFKYCCMDFPNGSFSVIVKISFSYQSVCDTYHGLV
jgi:hypothetical protein